MKDKILFKLLKLFGVRNIVKTYQDKISVLNSREYVLDRRTEKSKILELIRSLRPIDTGKNLIRLGPDEDGGYLVPDDFRGLNACFSPGVSGRSGFEKDCGKLGMKIFLADKSVSKPNLSGIEYDFIKKYIGCTTNDDFITMDDWVKDKLDDKSEILLQMDIEGAEYLSFASMSNDLMKRIRIMIIEFHNLDKLWMDSFYKIVSQVFGKILQTHTCIHIHPNNCCGLDVQDGIEIPRVAEFTFIRNDRFDLKKDAVIFPHPLDSDNTYLPHITLPEIWYKENDV